MLLRRIPPGCHRNQQGNGHERRCPSPHEAETGSARPARHNRATLQLCLHRESDLELGKTRGASKVMLLEVFSLWLGQAIEKVRLQNVSFFHFVAVHRFIDMWQIYLGS
jgi:hypothetical protein